MFKKITPYIIAFIIIGPLIAGYIIIKGKSIMKILKNYINGQWIDAEGKLKVSGTNGGCLSCILFSPQCSCRL